MPSHCRTRAFVSRGERHFVCLVTVELGAPKQPFYLNVEGYKALLGTTNAIERTIKEIRKRLKPMNSLNSLEAAEKVVYLTIQDFNEKWAGRKLRGFAEAHEALERMFEERYH